MSQIDPSASVASSAVVTGDVTIGAHSRVLHGAVLNGDLGPVRIGSYVVVMEHALLRGRPDHPLTIGDAVLVGPHTHLNGTTIEDEVFVATGVSMFPGSRAGAGVRAADQQRAARQLRARAGHRRPDRLDRGRRPAELFSPDRHDELWAAQEPLDFPGTVYGVPRGTSMREIMRRQCEAFPPQ